MRCKSKLLFVGSGELGQQLEQEALIASQNLEVESIFPGFVNQSSLVNWYLAADIVVLPSRKAGETWGLVANEALQAGCGVVVSEAVGCAADFGGWERFRTIPVGSPQALAQALVELAAYPRNHSWAAEALQNYSIEAAAQALASAISELP
jgi:glycosyltransferase involved in cell wall biosynthesis